MIAGSLDAASRATEDLEFDLLATNFPQVEEVEGSEGDSGKVSEILFSLSFKNYLRNIIE